MKHKKGASGTIWCEMAGRIRRFYRVEQQDGAYCILQGETEASMAPAPSMGTYSSRTEAQNALDAHARTHGWYNAGCGRCWHLRNKGKSCDFFYSTIESAQNGAALRCEKCLAWGQNPPG